jgi:hypothetical protein
MRVLLIIAVLFTVTACKVSFSFTGASISPEMKTYSVQTFPNRAPIFQPSLSSVLTNALQDKIQSQSRLKLVGKNGDAHFEGEITGYNTRDISVQGNNLAAQTRLTISVRVRYINAKDKKAGFDESFSRYADYPTSKNLSEVENQLIQEIVEQLTEDIFNKAFVNW